MSSPALSIVVLSYNRPAYLRTALDSALAQERTDIEIVIADDCSPDPAVHATLLEYAKRDPRVVYERAERNVGVVANFLRAVARSHGKYVTILCDDDVLDPAYAARLLQPFERSNTLVVTFCDAVVIDAAGLPNPAETRAFARRWQRTGMSAGTLHPFIDAALGVRSLQPAMGAVFKKDAVAWNEFPPETGPAWDLWLAYLAARAGGPAAYVSERLMRYRVHPGAVSMRREVGWHRGQVYIYERLVADDRLAALRAVFATRLARYRRATGMALLRRGERRAARDEFRESLRIRRSPKTIVGSALSYLPSMPVRSLFASYDTWRTRARTMRAKGRARAHPL